MLEEFIIMYPWLILGFIGLVMVGCFVAMGVLVNKQSKQEQREYQEFINQLYDERKVK